MFFNDGGHDGYLGVRPDSEYTSDAPAEDFGACTGPVHQKRGCFGTVHSSMQDSNGKVLVDRVRTVGSCN